MFFSGIISPLISCSILGTYQPGEFIFQCPMFLPFDTVHGVLKARILKWFAIPFSSWPHFVRTLHHDPSVLGGPTQHVKRELPDGQAGFRKGRGTRDQIANILWIVEKTRVPEKDLFLIYWLCQSLWLCGWQQIEKFWKRWEYQTTWPASWDICMQVKRQQLELDMEQ